MAERSRLTERTLAPPDADQRARVAGELDRTLFVEAGAGSGKTTALVDRLVALVEAGEELRSIAAITFTEKAGAELRDRLRRALERRAEGAPEPSGGTRVRAALDQLDGAAIGTLHAFAQRLLSEHPVEAGLPPRVQVLDEVSSGVEFERRWASFQEELLADPAIGRTILLLLAAGVRTAALHTLARAFDRNWDLVELHVREHEPEPPTVHDTVAPALDELAAVCDERRHCNAVDDKLSQRLDEIAAYVARLRTIDDEVALLDAIADAPSTKVGGSGRKGCWDLDLADLRARVRAAGDGLEAVAGTVAQACAHRLGSAIRRFTITAAAERRAAGRLEFHDLLVLARAVLTDPVHGAEVRRRLHERYRRILLDELQDTDPIQIELAVRIAAARPESAEAGTAPWTDVDVRPGHIFVVGDPKQSIYRFRRADIATFIRARDRFGPEGGGVAELTANFRTGAPVIDWVNTTFATLMAEPPDHELPLSSQTAYVPLQAVRPGPAVGPPVAVIGRHAHPVKTGADVVRAFEADDVAATIQRIMAEGWLVGDGVDDAGTERWRPARLGDITILVPARTSLPLLDNALGDAGIPYRAESSSIVYATRAVRDLLMVLRAVDDPSDRLRTVAALRTPLFACGDDDLVRFRVERQGSLDILRREQPDTVPPDDPVLVSLRVLRELHDQRRWCTPSELLDRVARDRRALELGFAEGRPRDVWRRLRFVIDQARAWHEATGGSLREYLTWVGQQTAEGARVAEAVLPETDDDAVRVMTIHAAKGLEFPITIVSGTSSLPNTSRAPAEVRFPHDGGVAYRLGARVQTVEFTATVPIDEQMGLDERIRLLYVATTRARDHLVVSLHRVERASSPPPARRTNAELLVDGMGDALADLPDGPGTGGAPPPVVVAAPAPPRPFAAWRADLDARLAAASRPTTVAATALTDEGHPDAGEPDADADELVDGLRKRPRDLDLPPWLKGRYGTSVGRAVHGVLQTVDLASHEGVDDAVAAQCEAEAIPDQAPAVRRLVGQALGSEVVREAAAVPHWREVYACTPVDGGRMLEGYVDLLARGPDGLVVVDYKTARSADPDLLDARVAGYRLQGASYALAVAATTGEQVARVVFLFLTPSGAVERPLDRLDDAVADVRRLVAEGRELEAPEPAGA